MRRNVKRKRKRCKSSINSLNYVSLLAFSLHSDLQLLFFSIASILSWLFLKYEIIRHFTILSETNKTTQQQQPKNTYLMIVSHRLFYLTQNTVTYQNTQPKRADLFYLSYKHTYAHPVQHQYTFCFVLFW